MRIHKQQATPVRTQIFPDIPWKLQQVGFGYESLNQCHACRKILEIS